MKRRIPGPPAGDTFEWLMPPADAPANDTMWFIDGAMFDEVKRFARRTGFGIVGVETEGTLLAFGRGVPPSWVHDAAGAEV